MHLLRAFGEQADGFYIDIGAGHPVYDNVSFAFYLRGWRGITVEPNPWLAQLSEAVRPRDIRVQSLVGETAGRSDLLSRRGFSRLLDDGRRPRTQRPERIRQGVARDDRCRSRRCARCASNTRRPPSTSSRSTSRAPSATCCSAATGSGSGPKIVVLEALAPITMAPAWEAWEPLLLDNGYRFAFFDSLNRYYVADEHAALAERLAAPGRHSTASSSSASSSRPWTTPRIPTTASPGCSPANDMVRLPLMSPDTMVETLIKGVDPIDLSRPRRTGRHRRRPPAAVRHRAQRRRGRMRFSLASDRHDPRPLPQCGRHRSVPGRLRPHLGQLRLVTVPSHQAFRSALACCLHSPFAIALGSMRP